MGRRAAVSELVLESNSPEETRRIGRAVGEGLAPGARVALIGPLGAGKTCFVQGLAAGLGCSRAARSPSYVLVHEYQGRCPLYHCDWYRLDTDGDVESTGFEDLLRPDSVVVVEWADKHPGWLAAPRLDVVIECLSPNRRRIHLKESEESEEPGQGAYGPALAACAKQAH